MRSLSGARRRETTDWGVGQMTEGESLLARGIEDGDAEFAPRSPEPDWRRAHAQRLVLSDVAALLWVVVGTQIVLIGGASFDGGSIAGRQIWFVFGFPLALVAVWHVALELTDTRSDRVLGWGGLEYQGVLDATLLVFGSVATVAYVFDVESVKPFLFVAMPGGLVMLLAERWLWRQWLLIKRRAGELSATVLLIGSAPSVRQVATELARTPAAGYRVVGACIPGGRVGEEVAGTGIPVMGGADAVEEIASGTGADTVIITSADVLAPDKVQEISWGLEPATQRLVLAPSLVGVAGTRIHTRAIAGMPLLHVETPQLSPADRVTKRAFDVAASAALVLVASPLLLGLALAVRLTSPGPVLYRSQRIGLRGEPFPMLKFRSMRVGADLELADLLREQGTSETPLFKVHDDPRITPLGRFMRKYSLDELPQLLNVVAGSMSLVGPRPQIAAEVAMYSDSARRRLLTRPGLTGLWQVSGRSSLGWDDAVRLDLFYVENWSLLGDVGILARTVKAVVLPGETAH
ncbi:sugar transferase [Demequina capsici]|uniref:Sugar transferase n=1 Tax=Demequina capsici TaxID=3075620 RepID=A0AA96JB88_9MICO|nr:MULTISPECIES: sugar transferase [unclassified Demequina]WNM25516.1 sugar transferase [Demequina sp. OYTSA14]WNM28407.1 sugar transferase [Demequina sp. PMTSA13]